MGRGSGGASHGGGGHSGGHSFGGRGSSGGMGGGRLGGSARGSRPGGPRPGGFGFGPGPMPPPRPPRPPRRYWGPRRTRGGGCFSTIAVCILIIVIFAMIRSDMGGSKPDVSQSATQRTPITGTKTSREWYLDEMAFIDHDTDLIDGLKYFYSKTGIQPYVMFMDYDSAFWNNGKWNEKTADEYLAEVYKNIFSNDNGHLILAYFACENDSEDMDGTFYLYYGSAAYSIMDKEAETIFWSYFDANYDNLDYSIGEFIGKSFRQTADNIMHIEKDDTVKSIVKISFGAVIIVLVLVLFVGRKFINRPEE